MKGAALAALLSALPATALADEPRDSLERIGYVVPVSAAAVSSFLLWTAIAYDSAPAPVWPVVGYVSGAASLAAGAGYVAFADDPTPFLIALPFALGAASITGAWLCPRDVLVVPSSSGLSLIGRF